MGADDDEDHNEITWKMGEAYKSWQSENNNVASLIKGLGVIQVVVVNNQDAQ